MRSSDYKSFEAVSATGAQNTANQRSCLRMGASVRSNSGIAALQFWNIMAKKGCPITVYGVLLLMKYVTINSWY